IAGSNVPLRLPPSSQSTFATMQVPKMSCSNMFEMFEYDQKLGLIVTTRNAKLIRMFKWQSILSLIYTLATFLHVCFGRLSLVEKFQGSLVLPMDLLITAKRWNHSLDKSPGQIVNAFINFETEIMKDLPKAPTSLGTKLMRVFIPVFTISLTMAPLLEILLLLFAPCTPPFLLSMLPNCKECYTSGNLIQFGIRLFESWMQWHMLLTAWNLGRLPPICRGHLPSDVLSRST
ncbi:hypothetical protein Fcan01_22807, partial [Folsomia candida]